jgi:acyl-CoA synthetase (AMP-forming)/AMP-acid ligase II
VTLTPRATRSHLAAGSAWLGGMFAGCTHVIVPMFTPAGVAAAVSEPQVTDMLLVPTMIQMLVDAQQTADADLTSVRRVIYGASPISAALLDRARKRLEPAAFIRAYGMGRVTEAAR